MDAQLKQRWIDALRSGKYRQIKGELRSMSVEAKNEGFCCLGVLCEVAGVPRIEEDCGYEFKDPSQSDEPIIFGPLSVGLPQHDLATMNDDGEDFTAIAKWIEENVIDDGASPDAVLSRGPDDERAPGGH